jgi:hypothetical protein
MGRWMDLQQRDGELRGQLEFVHVAADDLIRPSA